MAADWRTIIADQVAVNAADARKRSRSTSATQRLTRTSFSVDAHPFLIRAARQRGLSLSSYVRRATLAFVALDLGLDQVDLFKLDAALSPFGQGGNPWSREFDLDGEIYGSWEVEYRDPRGDR